MTSELQYVTHKFLSPARAISLTALLVRRHYGQWLADILPSMIDAVVVAKGELCIVVTPPAIAHVMTFLRDHSNCQVRAPVRFLRAGRAGRMLTPPPRSHNATVQGGIRCHRGGLSRTAGAV